MGTFLTPTVQYEHSSIYFLFSYYVSLTHTCIHTQHTHMHKQMQTHTHTTTHNTHTHTHTTHTQHTQHTHTHTTQHTHQAKSIAQPFAYDEYREERIKQKVEEKRANRVKEKVGLDCPSNLLYITPSLPHSLTLWPLLPHPLASLFLFLTTSFSPFSSQKLPRVNKELAERLLDASKGKVYTCT